MMIENGESLLSIMIKKQWTHIFLLNIMK